MKCENEYEKKCWLENELMIGIDEAGRGPIAGPLVVAGVVFSKDYDHDEIYDSKKLSEKKRERLFEEIIQDALYYKIIIVDPERIDHLNIYRATQQAMNDIAESAECFQRVVTDAMPLPDCSKKVDALIKGDQKSVSVAAASILAKVTRDRIMLEYDKQYPEYGFAKHKGYPTKAHLEALEKYGVLPFYRKTYGPVARMNQIKLDL